MRILFKILILTLIFSSQVYAQGLPPLKIKDEGTSQGVVAELNCVGSEIACTKSGKTGVLTVSGTSSGWTDGGSTIYTTTNSDSIAIGTTSAGYKLTVSSPDATVIQGINTGASSSGNASVLTLGMDDGAAMGSGDGTGQIYFSGASNASHNFLNAARIRANTTEAWGASNSGAKLLFATVSNGGTSMVDRMVIDQSGYVGIGVSSPANTLDIASDGTLKIPNAANPTVSTAGQISIDTSSTSGGMLRYYDTAERALPAYNFKSFNIPNPATTDDFPLARIPYNITIRAIHVLCIGGTNVVGGLDEADANGGSAAAIDSDITGTAGTNVNDDGTLSNPTLDAGDYLLWHTTSVSGSPTFLNVTIDYTVDPVN